MYGTVARMMVKPGHEKDLLAMQKDWDQSRQPKAEGAVASYVFKSDNAENEYTLIAIFQDRASYRANAEDPDQDRWYREMRSHLEADPEWRDGEVIASEQY
jgi:quinol monooxygenase YgiN